MKLAQRRALYGTGAVANLVKLVRWRLVYLIDSGQLPEPTYSVPGRRLFTDEDVLRIEAALDANPGLRDRSRKEVDKSPGPDLREED